MTSIIKVDQIQTAAGAVPRIGDIGINDTGTLLQVVNLAMPVGTIQYTTNSLSWDSINNSETIATSKATNSRWVVNFTGLAAVRSAYPLSFDIWYSIDNGTNWIDMSGNRDESNHGGSGLGITGYWQAGGTDDWFPLSITVGQVITVSAGTSIKFRLAMRNGGPSTDVSTTLNCVGHGDYTMQMTVMEIAG
jgi:hypothetical protein